MQISSIYADRTDLSTFEKWKFTFEERVEQNAYVRSFYRRCSFLPWWVKDILEITWFLSGLPPLIIAKIIELLAQAILDGRSGESHSESVGLVLFLVILFTITYFHWAGWILILMTLQFIGGLWFSAVMYDYGEELRHEVHN